MNDPIKQLDDVWNYMLSGLSDFRRQNISQREESTRMTDHLAELTKDKDDAQRTIDGLSTELSLLMNDLNRSNDDFERSRTRIQTLRDQLNEANIEISRWEGRLQGLEQGKLDLVEMYQSTISGLKKEKEEISRVSKEKEERVSRVEMELLHTEAEMNRLKKGQLEVIHKLTMEGKKAVEAVEMEVQRAQEDDMSSKRERDDLVRSFDLKQTELSEQHGSALQAKETKVIRLQNDHLVVIRSVQGDKLKLEEDYSAGMVADLKAEIDRLQEEHDQALRTKDGENARLEKEHSEVVSELKDQLVRVQAECDKAKQTIITDRTKVEKEHSQVVFELKDQLVHLQAECGDDAKSTSQATQIKLKNDHSEVFTHLKSEIARLELGWDEAVEGAKADPTLVSQLSVKEKEVADFVARFDGLSTTPTPLTTSPPPYPIALNPTSDSPLTLIQTQLTSTLHTLDATKLQLRKYKDQAKTWSERYDELFKLVQTGKPLTVC